MTVCFSLACSKDKYTTKPQLKFKKAENYDVPKGGLIRFFLEFTDKEGDVSDTLFIQNRTPSCPASDFTEPTKFKVPDFPKSSNLKGELIITFENGTNNTGEVIYIGNLCARPDTTAFFFWLKDKAGNMSDTVSTDKSLIIGN